MSFDCFIFSRERCQVGECITTSFEPFYFFSKFPDKVSPIWNLTNLFKPSVWFLTFLSISLTLTYFTISIWIYSKLDHAQDFTSRDLVLAPFRWRWNSISTIFISSIILGWNCCQLWGTHTLDFHQLSSLCFGLSGEALSSTCSSPTI